MTKKIKNKNKPHFKSGQRTWMLNRLLSKDMQMANKHMRRYSTSQSLEKWKSKPYSDITLYPLEVPHLFIYLTFYSTGHWTRCAPPLSYIPVPFHILLWDRLAKLPKLVQNLRSSCLSLQSSWDLQACTMVPNMDCYIRKRKIYSVGEDGEKQTLELC